MDGSSLLTTFVNYPLRLENLYNIFVNYGWHLTFDYICHIIPLGWSRLVVRIKCKSSREFIRHLANHIIFKNKTYILFVFNHNRHKIHTYKNLPFIHLEAFTKTSITITVIFMITYNNKSNNNILNSIGTLY